MRRQVRRGRLSPAAVGFDSLPHLNGFRAVLESCRGALVTATLALGCIATPSAAERPGDKAWIQIGANFPKVDSDMQIDNDDFIIDSTAVDFENDLDLADRKVVPRIETGIRLGTGFRVEAGYFNLRRSGSTTLSRIAVIDDHVFPVSTEVESHLRTRIYRVAGGYSFLRNDQAELGAAVGAHLGKFRASVATERLLPGDVEPRSETRHEAGPLPHAGLYGSYALSKVFAVEGRVDAFKLKLGDYKGRFVDANVRISARFHKNIAVGVGYAYSVYKLDVDKSRWDGTFKYKYWGPATYLEFVF